MNLETLQKKVKLFTNEKDIVNSVEARIIDISSEVGELCKEVLKGTDYCKKPFNSTENWKHELGDVLFSLICIANESNTNLDECLELALQKYEYRYSKNGAISSK